MYEYIEFVQHSKDSVKASSADIAALKPSQSLPGVTVAIKMKNGRFLKVMKHVKWVRFDDEPGCRQPRLRWPW